MNEWRTENSCMQADTLTKRKKKIENGGDIINTLDP